MCRVCAERGCGAAAVSAHLVLSVVTVAVGLAVAVVGLAVVAGRIDGTRVQREVRERTSAAQRAMAVRAVRRRLVVPADEAAVVAAVARGQLSQANFTLIFAVGAVVSVSVVGSGSPSWLQVASPAVALADAAVAVVLAIRAWGARRYLAAHSGPDSVSVGVVAR